MERLFSKVGIAFSAKGKRSETANLEELLFAQVSVRPKLALFKRLNIKHTECAHENACLNVNSLELVEGLILKQETTLDPDPGLIGISEKPTS